MVTQRVNRPGLTAVATIWMNMAKKVYKLNVKLIESKLNQMCNKFCPQEAREK